jgi:hypothetical protein
MASGTCPECKRDTQVEMGMRVCKHCMTAWLQSVRLNPEAFHECPDCLTLGQSVSDDGRLLKAKSPEGRAAPIAVCPECGLSWIRYDAPIRPAWAAMLELANRTAYRVEG